MLVLVAAMVLAGGSQAGAVRAKRFPSWAGFRLGKTASVGVRPVTGRKPRAKRRVPGYRPTAVHWPAASAAAVRLAAGKTTQVPGASVAVAPAGVLTSGRLRTPVARRDSAAITRLASVGSANVTVAAHATAAAAGIDGVIVAVSTPQATAARSFSVKIDYSRFADAYGGDYASRLHLVQLPGCALTTPRKPACQVQTPLPASVNDASSQTLRGDVAVPSRPTPRSLSTGAARTAQPQVVMAAAAAPASGSGSYAATPLASSGSWSVGNTGAFTYTYPVTAPASIGDDAPAVALSYDSASVDGRTSATNSQASWVGDGWDYNPGFIERSYKNCTDDGHSDSGDECWAIDNATLSLNGHSGLPR